MRTASFYSRFAASRPRIFANGDRMGAAGSSGTSRAFSLSPTVYRRFWRRRKSGLKAQGYTTWRSPEGADGGVDILAGAGPLGFGTPRLCVEVKSEAAPIDRPTVDKLLGAVQKFGAQEGLFISWSGFKSTVQKELASSFFSVRLWTQKELLEALFLVYDKLDEHIKAEIPLKRIWTVAIPEEE